MNEDLNFNDGEFLSDVDISLENFAETLRRHPALYFKYGKIHAGSLHLLEVGRVNLETKKRELERLKASIELEIRANPKPEVKVTEASIAALVLQDARLVEAYRDYAETQKEIAHWQYTTNVLELAAKIFSKRSDLLNTLGWFLTSERRSDVQIMSRDQVSRDIGELREHARRIVKQNRERS
jgi:hypothetical protein